MRVLVHSLGSLGDLNPFLSLADELKRRGHEVVFSVASTHADAVRERGFEPRAIDLADDLDERTVAKLVFDEFRGAERLLRDLVFPRSERIYQAVSEHARGADLLVSGSLAFSASLVHEALGLPWVSVALQPAVYLSPYQFPAVPFAPWLEPLVSGSPLLGRALTGVFRRQVDSWAAPWKSLRAKLGLDPDLNPLFEGTHSPLLQLAAYPEFFAPRAPDWPSHRGHVGFFQRAIERDAPLEPELESFLGAGEPPVVATMGSAAVHAGDGMMEILLRASSRRKVRTVVSCGPLASEWRPRFAGLSHALVVGWAPYARLFARARLVVHQGGIGTTAEALRAGVPMIVVPFGQDQYDTAARVRRMNAGLSAPLKGLNPQRLLSAIDRALDSEFVRYDDRMKTGDPERAACDAIERVLPRTVAG